MSQQTSARSFPRVTLSLVSRNFFVWKHVCLSKRLLQKVELVASDQDFAEGLVAHAEAGRVSDDEDDGDDEKALPHTRKAAASNSSTAALTEDESGISLPLVLATSVGKECMFTSIHSTMLSSSLQSDMSVKHRRTLFLCLNPSLLHSDPELAGARFKQY